MKLKQAIYTEYSDPSIPIRNVRVLMYDSLTNVLWAGSEGYGLNQIFLDENIILSSIQTYQHIPGRY